MRKNVSPITRFKADFIAMTILSLVCGFSCLLLSITFTSPSTYFATRVREIFFVMHLVFVAIGLICFGVYLFTPTEKDASGSECSR